MRSTQPCISSLLRLLISLILFPSANASTTLCNHDSPIQIPIRNRTVGGQFLRRGIVLSVGSPAQNLVVEASGRFNNTYLYDSYSPYCSAPTTDSQVHCNAESGGWFDEASSTSWIQAPRPGVLPIAAESLPDHAIDVFGNDTIHLNSTLNVIGFPFGLNRGIGGVVGDVMNSMGLGANLTLLNALVSTKAIASRTWGYSQGWTVAEAEHQVDGSLVLGGYDAAKTKGNNLSVPFSNDPHCVSKLVVTITDIKVNLRNGSNPSLLGSSAGTALRGCISPDYPLISLSEDIWHSFVSIAGDKEMGRAYDTNYRGLLVSARGSYDGNLTISLSLGLDIMIPNHQLVVPDFGVNEQGQPVIFNETTRNVLIASLISPNQNDMPLLGRAFLTSAYLVSDKDRSQFALYSGNPTTSKDLVAIQPSGCTEQPLNSPIPSSGVNVTSSGGNISSSRGKVLPSKGGLSNGAIVGIVVGVVALFALVTLASLLVWRRRARPRAVDRQGLPEKSDKPDSYLGHLSYSDRVQFTPEMASDQKPLPELPLAQHPSYTLSPYEMPADLHHHELHSA